MIKTIIDKLQFLLKDRELRKKIVFTFIIFLIFRIFAFVPVPSIDLVQLKKLFSQNQFLTLLDIFSGGTLINFSVMALGINPYITASIIFQLMTVMVPKFEQLAKEGDYGKFKINQYTRMLTVPLTFMQAVGIYFLLRNQKIIGILTPLEFFSFIFTLVAGTFILVWFGELISEFGIGNGISLIIFVGIVAKMPVLIYQTFQGIVSQTLIINLVVFIALVFVVIASVVFVNEATRRVPVFYAKRMRGNRMYQAANNYLPLKLNQAGVIPIIFAVSFVLFPLLIGNFLSGVKSGAIAQFAQTLIAIFNPEGFVYNLLYFFLVIGFTFFYTVVIFNPQKIAEDIQKYGGFIPGIRPGNATKEYLEKILYRITSVGAIFLGVIAILPVFVSKFTGLQNLVIGGTGILIVVSVVLETFKLIEARLVMRKYDQFAK